MRELVFQKHENHDKRYLVGRGIKDVETLGHIYQWNNNTRTSYWKNEGVCNKVGGTDGSIFPPHTKKNRVFYVFNTDICRSCSNHCQINFTLLFLYALGRLLCHSEKKSNIKEYRDIETKWPGKH